MPLGGDDYQFDGVASVEEGYQHDGTTLIETRYTMIWFEGNGLPIKWSYPFKRGYL